MKLSVTLLAMQNSGAQAIPTPGSNAYEPRVGSRVVMSFMC